MNDYLDYNNEEVSKYTKVVDPRELNVAQRINELKDHKPTIIEDDPVTINRMKVDHNTIICASDDNDKIIEEAISNIQKDQVDDIIEFSNVE